MKGPALRLVAFVMVFAAFLGPAALAFYAANGVSPPPTPLRHMSALELPGLKRLPLPVLSDSALVGFSRHHEFCTFPCLSDYTVEYFQYSEQR